MDQPQIGVVIPSFNDRPFLETLFDSLYATTAGASFFPVVVDDLSDDGTESWVKKALSGYASVIRLNQKGRFTRACNAGIHWHKDNLHPDFYFLLNSDTVVTNGWGVALIATAKRFAAGIVGATLLNPDGTLQHAGAYGLGYHFDINKPWVRYHEDRIVPWVTGAAMCIRKDVIERIGYLPQEDEGKQYDASDRNFCTNARMGGFEIAQSAGCVIYHYTLKAEGIRKPRGDY